MRSFVAIELPDAIRKSIAALCTRVSDAARAAESSTRVSWVDPERMHLTLRFLGEVDEEGLNRIAAILADGLKTAVPFTLKAARTGVFPNTRKPSVMWVGIGPLAGGLQMVHDTAEDAARAIGLAPDNKTFHPHVTLARIRDGRDAGPLMEAFDKRRDFAAGEFEVHGVSLFSSRLTPKGPIHDRLREFRF